MCVISHLSPFGQAAAWTALLIATRSALVGLARTRDGPVLVSVTVTGATTAR